MISGWITNNYIEVFGAVTGILYVFLEIRQTIWLWPVGLITSAVYIWVFFTGKLYADMCLQVYYLVISIIGWYWWAQGSGLRAQGSELRAQSKKNSETDGKRGKFGELEKGIIGEREKKELMVTRVEFKTGMILAIVFVLLFVALRLLLGRLTDSPVPGWDSFITSLSIIATWMLARKIFEHWFLWIVINTSATGLFLSRGLYPTVVLYIVYGTMSFVGLMTWKKTIRTESNLPENA